MHPSVLHRRFLNDLSSSLFSFVLPLLPPGEELSVKEELAKPRVENFEVVEIQQLLLTDGTQNDPQAKVDPGNFVESMGSLLERETNFNVKPLPRARIPILKLELAPSPALPFGIACDIGIENRLAIENTRLLLTYATIDPARVRTLVLFHGYTLMVLYYLVHVKQPPVLPNLQRIMPMRPLVEEEVMLEGRNVYFFDDVETLRRDWSSVNFESVGELLVDFFRYFSHDFQFNNSVLSLRAGQLTKESKGWVNDIDDPFEISYNVARTVTKDGLYTIRGEFMRATRRPERAVLALAELCREREDELQRAPRSSSPAPRSLSASRSNFVTASHSYRSRSQAPFDRLGSNGSHEAGIGRDDNITNEHSALDLWLQSQGVSLGGVQARNTSELEDPGTNGAREREILSHGLDTDASYLHKSTWRSGSAYDNYLAPLSGAVSAPLSPDRMYAQLKLGKSVGDYAGGQSMWEGYDPRLHAGAGMPMSISGPSEWRSQNHQRVSQVVSGRVDSRQEPHFSAFPHISPTFPSSTNSTTPPNITIRTNALAPNQTQRIASNGSPANFISPSTLLSPSAILRPLPVASNSSQRVDLGLLADSFDQLDMTAKGDNDNPSNSRHEKCIIDVGVADALDMILGLAAALSQENSLKLAQKQKDIAHISSILSLLYSENLNSF
uniref:polynucleotide adenylyltransferase n=1 Tax=Cryptococcus depauperatus TaxID=5208 RepID=D2JWV3_9TREE|nr:putative DNA polymerase sigma [Cryptococcus depauperatus]